MGNDIVFGGWGDDTLDGGAGADRLFGGEGDDRLVFTFEADAGGRCKGSEYYDGGRGFDTLALNLTAAQWADPNVQADILALLDRIDGPQGGGPGSFEGVTHLHALGLKVRSIEAVELYVDGVLIDPRNPGDSVAAVDDDFLTEEDSAVAGDVGANDTAPAGAVFTLVSGVSAGTLTLNGDGTFSFDPVGAFDWLADGASTTESFSYELAVGGTTSVATVTLSITGTNDTPTVDAALTASVAEDDPAFALDLLAGASDVDDGAVLSVINVSPLPGGVSLSGTTLTVDPSDAAFQYLMPGATLDIVVSYDITDEFGAVVPQTATITITGTNDAPEVSAAVEVTTNEDEVSAVADLLSTASDVDDLAVLSVTGLVQTGGAPVPYTLTGGTLEIDPSGFQHLAVGESDSVTFEYEVSDGYTTTPATVTFTIEGRNDAPVTVGAIALQLAQLGTPFSLAAAGVFDDIDAGDTLTYSAQLADGGALPAWLSIDPATGALSGTPTETLGLHQIELTATDPSGESASTTFWLAETDRYLIGTPDQDSLIGTNWSEIVIGLESNDTLRGGDGSDVYVVRAGEGMDVIEDNGFLDTDVVFLAGLLPGEVGFERYTPGSDDLVITLGGEPIALIRNSLNESTQDEIEQILFDDGTVLDIATIRELLLTQEQGTGGERVYGFDFAETLGGTTGADYLQGDDGSDTYLFRAGDGNDVIRDEGFLDTDRVEFVDHASIDASFSLYPGTGADLVIDLAGGDRVVVQDTVESSSINQIEELYFAGDGVTLTMDDIRTILIGQSETAGDDVITGFDASEDRLEGGAGDDYLSGGRSSDTYVFNMGDGEDRILDGGFLNTDVLEFTDYTLADATLSRSADALNDLIVTFANGDKVTVLSTLNGDSINAVEEVRFLGGGTTTTLTMADIRDLLIADEAAGAGDDQIVGWSTGDTILNGAGDDFLQGGDGSDTYVMGSFVGRDVIRDGGFADTDVIDLTDYTMADASFRWQEGAANNLVVTLGSGAEILVLDQTSVLNGIESFSFSDGTLLAADVAALADVAAPPGDVFTGAASPDTLSADGGYDHLFGLQGGDTYEFDIGDGRVEIEDNGNGVGDALVFTGYNFADATFGVLEGDRSDLRIGFAGGDEVLLRNTLSGSFADAIETVSFSDAVSLSLADIRQLLVDQAITAGDDTVRGFGGAEVLTGGAGDDLLIGGGGGDSYSYFAGDGDDVIRDLGNGSGDAVTIVGYDLADAAVTFLPGGNDIVLDFGSGDRLTLRDTLVNGFANGIEQVTFDGAATTVMTMADFRALRIAQQQTAGDDHVTGSASGEMLEAGLGDDMMIGGQGGDTYVYNLGDGHDLINDNGNGVGDSLVINGIASTDTVLERSVANDADVTLHFAGGGSVTLSNTLADAFADAIEVITFTDDATNWSMADLRASLLEQATTAGDDWIRGFSVADTITGGAGDDMLSGYGGTDTYVFAVGDGNDIVHDQGNGGSDTLVFLGRDIAEASFSELAPGDPDLLITLADGSSVTVVNGVGGGFIDGIEFYTFDDGTLAHADVLAML